MADQVVAVDQVFQARVDGAENLWQVDALDHVQQIGIGCQLLEIEAAVQRSVEQGDGAVGGVHRAEDVEVRRQGEALAGAGQRHGDFVRRARAFILLQKRDGFPEHLGDVGAVDLVDDKDVGQPRFGRAGALRDALQHAVFRGEVESGVALTRLGAQPLDELLVAAGLMKGDEFDTTFFDQRS